MEPTSVMPPAEENRVAPASATEVHQFAYRGDGVEYLGVLLKTILLTLVTFGVYAAWAKVQRRKYVWEHLSCGDEAFGFHGTGREIFIGYLKVAGVYFGMFLVMFAVGQIWPSAAQFAVLLPAIVGATLAPFAMYWARRYLLSRTSWRGVRFGLDGQARSYAWAMLKGGLLTILTLGFYAPYLTHNLRHITWNRTRYGSQSFVYDGTGRELFRIWLPGVLKTVCTLGLYSFSFQAQMLRYYVGHLQLDGARGRSTVDGWALFKIALSSLTVPLTLGLAFPSVFTYALRVVAQGVRFEGSIAFDRIYQVTTRANPAADGLSDALGVSLGI